MFRVLGMFTGGRDNDKERLFVLEVLCISGKHERTVSREIFLKVVLLIDHRAHSGWLVQMGVRKKSHSSSLGFWDGLFLRVRSSWLRPHTASWWTLSLPWGFLAEIGWWLEITSLEFPFSPSILAVQALFFSFLKWHPLPPISAFLFSNHNPQEDL